ncbi:hypothetical protein NDR87_32950 [Nocardia sp. CDC159]|uniref:Uncharacterized protein n=1 Tax=Nocardia pulmonis TaxID=2951408 RepID=A0A9X2ECU7_9NOCA|nr:MULTISPECIES: hypothetical protein [Nocardia]MCM6778412.1 hypothetical protein [Nocardia pulmonis]MCM6791192.1 hypothetical protein [Nocardia sp. CDC159]
MELYERPRWRRTGNAYFPVAALVDGQWWVLRINSFPDHPIWTLFVDAERRFDIDIDQAPSWRTEAEESAPVWENHIVQRILSPIQNFVAYGSEVGKPCDNLFCCG